MGEGMQSLQSLSASFSFLNERRKDDREREEVRVISIFKMPLKMR